MKRPRRIVVAADEQDAEGDAFAFQGEQKCVDSEFHGLVEDVEEIAPDDLDDEEAAGMAEDLATEAEGEQLKQMSRQELRDWIKGKLEDQ
jgi:hypothetical protein